MARIKIDYGQCTSCGKCINSCNYGVLEILDNMVVVVSPGKCAVCGRCMNVCSLKPSAISVIGERTGDSCTMYKK